MKWNKKNDILALMVGHGTQLNGKWDSGCAYGKYTEAALMLKIVKVAVSKLRKSGVRVLTDADKGNNRNMKSSVAWANKNKCKLYMSVHCDYSKATAGVAPLYKTAKDKDFAVKVGKKVASLMKMKWKGAFKRTDLYELNAPTMTSVIFETGAIKADLKYLKNYKAYGKALAKAICAYIGVKYINKTKGEKLCETCDKLVKDMNKNHMKYKNKNAKTYKGALKNGYCNCAGYVSYSLQDMGTLKTGDVFYIKGDDVKCNSDGCKNRLYKASKVSHPHKAPKSLKLKKGDICGYSTPHTQVFAGWKKDKKGNKVAPLWYSWGTKDPGKSEPLVKRTYSSRKIDTIIRLK